MSVPRILVTGCAGYIGSTLVGHLLKARCRVIGVDNLMFDNGSALLPFLGDPNFEFFNGDVTDSALMVSLVRYCDSIVPLAAIVGAPLCDREPSLAKAVNYEAIKTIVAAASPDQRIVYPNTNSGYGQTDGNSFVTEEDPLTPISVYGRTKCDAEKVVLDHPNSATLRLATVFGASPRMRMDLMVNDFTGRIYALKQTGGSFSIFEPHFKRNFVGVQDVARAFLFMLMNSWHKGAYNLGLPTANLTKMELALRICDVLGVSREVVKVGDGKDPDQRNYLVSNDKILSAGFEFRHDLETGIREVAQVVSLLPAEQVKKMRNI